MRPTKVAKTVFADAVDSTTEDVAMADLEAVTESSNTSAPEPLNDSNSEQPIDEPAIETTAAVSEAEALPPTNVVPVPSDEDEPMADTEEAPAVEVPHPIEATEVAPKVSSAVEESKEAVVEEPTEALTEQIKKTDSDAGDEPKIVDVDVGAMDVDMADVASAVNGSAVEMAVEPAVKASEEKKEVKQVGAEELPAVVETEGPREEVQKIVVDEAATADLILGKAPEVESELKPLEQKEDVVDDAVKGEVAVEKTVMEVNETEATATPTAQDEHSEAAVAVTEPALPVNVDGVQNGVQPPVTVVDAQTVSLSDQQITNGNAAELTIPITVEQSDTASTLITSSSPAILSASSETNERTETTSSDTTAGKEKVSRVEITIEQVEKLPGQTTQTTTTTHIVKEIIIKEQQHVVSPGAKSEEIIAADVTEQLNAKTNGSDVMAKTNGKEVVAEVGEEEEEKNGDDSDKENEVSTTNGSGAAAAIAESEHLADVVLKKCTSGDKPIETVPDVTA